MITIRPMTRHDKAHVMRILHTIPEFKPSEVVVAEEVIDSYLHAPGGPGYHIFVAEADATVAGYICYGPTPLTDGTWDVYWLAVVPQRRGQGIGSALMAFAEGKVKEAQGRLALVETSSQPEYERTRRFYQRQGYEIICRIPDFYAPADDKLVFRKHLR